MPAARFTPPSQWEDWCSWGLGIWLCIAPWALRFDLEPGATRAAVITGVLLILVEAITLSVFRAWEEWLNVVLGAVADRGAVGDRNQEHRGDGELRHRRAGGAGARRLRDAQSQ